METKEKDWHVDIPVSQDLLEFLEKKAIENKLHVPEVVHQYLLFGIEASRFLKGFKLT